MEDLERFSRLIANLRAGGLGGDRLVAEAEQPFQRLLRPELLPSELLRSDGVRTVRFVLYRSDAVTLFATASAPGTITDIHDHGVWGLVGQVLGQEVERAYRLQRADAEGLLLEHVSSCHLKPGDVSLVLPPERDIHQVVTVSSEPSVSLHAFSHDLVHEGFTRYPPTRYSPKRYSGHWDNELP